MAESDTFENLENFGETGSFEGLEGLSSPAMDDVASKDSAVDDTIGQKDQADSAEDNSPVTDSAVDDSAVDDAIVEDKPKSGLFADFNIYDGILMASLLFILLSTFFLFIELTGGGLDGSWRTGSVGR